MEAQVLGGNVLITKGAQINYIQHQQKKSPMPRRISEYIAKALLGRGAHPKSSPATSVTHL